MGSMALYAECSLGWAYSMHQDIGIAFFANKTRHHHPSSIKLTCSMNRRRCNSAKTPLIETESMAFLTSLLNFAAYPPTSIFDHVGHMESLNLGNGNGNDNGNKMVFKSFLTDDHTPIEFSMLWSKDKDRSQPAVRYVIEPLGDPNEFEYQEDVVKSNLRAAKRVLEGMCNECEQGIWTRVLLERMICHGHGSGTKRKDKGDLNLDTVNTSESQIFCGWDLDRKGGRMGKVYCIPNVLSRQVYTPPLNLLAQLLPSSSSFTLLLNYITSLPLFRRPAFSFLACDASKSNRLKAYFRLPTLYFPHILDALSLGNQLQPPAHFEAADTYAELWESVTGFDPRTYVNPPPSPIGAQPFVYYELGDDKIVGSKLYIPVNHLAPNDDIVATGIEAFLQRRGYQGSEGYKDTVSRIW